MSWAESSEAILRTLRVFRNSEIRPGLQLLGCEVRLEAQRHLETSALEKPREGSGTRVLAVLWGKPRGDVSSLFFWCVFFCIIIVCFRFF